METRKIDENRYEITCYDWNGGQGDRVIGTADRRFNGNDGKYWHFSPRRDVELAINCGDLKRISMFLSELNEDST